MQKKVRKLLEAGLIRHKKVPEAWQTKAQELVGLPFPLPWLMIGGLLFGLSWAMIANENYTARIFPLLAINSFLIAALGNAVVYFEMLLDEMADNSPELLDKETDDINQWISLWYDRMFWSPKNLLAGLGLAVVFIPLNQIMMDQFCLQFMGSKIVTYTLLGFMNFMAGSAFWAMLCIALMFLSLGGEMKTRSSIFDSNTSLLRSASSIMWHTSLVSALIYLSGISIIYFCKLHLAPIMLFVTVFFGIFILGYFVVPQISLHKELLKEKRKQLQKLVTQIDRSYDVVTSEPTQENIDLLQDLFHIQAEVSGRKSWSFGMGELLALVSTIVIPLLLFFCEYLLDKPD